MTFTVEIFDMGGNPRFEKFVVLFLFSCFYLVKLFPYFRCRNVYIDGCHGFIFVWDCALEGTYHSLQKWLQEISAAIEVSSLIVGG